MIVLIAIALSAAAPAGQAAVEGGASATSADRTNGAKRLCRREVPVGSIMPGKRICLTSAQWSQVGDIRESRADGFYHRPTRGIDLPNQ